MDINELWTDYKLNNSLKTRDYLTNNYFFLIDIISKKMITGLPNSVELDDLVSYGSLGLLDAIEKFEPERGYKFETYASQRIRGAILDGLRSMDHVSRTTRSNNKFLAETLSVLETELGRIPNDQEIAEHMGVSLDKLKKVYINAASSGTTSIDRGFEDEYDHYESIVDHRTNDDYTSHGIHRSLTDAIEALGEKEKAIVTLYYYDGLTLAEIGTMLGVTDSRVCQIHTKLIHTLTDHIKDAI